VSDAIRPRLLEVLEQSRALGFLGPGPVDAQVAHAEAFLDVLDVEETAPGPFLDLGTGGGIPGLVLACALPHARWVLLDSMVRRTRFLDEAVVELGLADRVEVVTARAEAFGRDALHRGSYRAVVARSFAAPPLLAECAAPLLVRGGVVVVSEPPADADTAGPRADRWPEAGLATVGLEVDRWVPGPPAFVRLRLAARVRRTYPRAVGVPAKDPLW
jgi:16S rRNA (guanine527-N7)-methyltransferase